MRDVHYIIEQSIKSDILRLTTAGSVDDGKSTLIGRLLYDSKNIFDDHLQAVNEDSSKWGRDYVDYALLTDGLKAEREQGITIDVAYRYFSTPKRRFIIADTPGHEEYTRNMVTGASTADLAIILIDACKGLVTQSKRHSFVSSLLGIPHIVIAVNKMDLVDYSEYRYNQIREEYLDFASKLEIDDITFIPLSALKGDNIVHSSVHMPWYEGPSLMSFLENVYTGAGRNLVDFRFPVQMVNRPHLNFRGFAGRIASGTVKKGDGIKVLPSGQSSHVKSIVTMDGELTEAFMGMSVTITLEDEIDISRGDMIVHSHNLPHVDNKLEVILVWMGDEPSDKNKTYLIKHSSHYEKALITCLNYRVNPDNLHREDVEFLQLNEIGRVCLELFNPIPFDEYSRNRSTGGLILIDPDTNITIGAGMIINRSLTYGKNIYKHTGVIGHSERCLLLNNQPLTYWLTGLSGSGKSTIAFALEKEFYQKQKPVYVLDGDNVRHGLNKDLGFSIDDRHENIRRIAEVARLFNDAGITVIASFISPFEEDRIKARAIIGPRRFCEIFVDTPLEICIQRDPKGLYKKAIDGKIKDFTGIKSSFEAPAHPQITIDTTKTSIKEAVDIIQNYEIGID
ncbi:sulfate adenylyltransferase subunit CysN [Spirochaeta cellobiosiphila]|uniref:sulfate adenylyltransferase subunit CysN n=1 Tax=Spirochaeta cellobiosiphila TaxID=504483 RepID=UPI000412E3FB|nr:sulfate adenylyltransferase subunit CysN [Spirochaeta cellobiosiphila]